MSETASHTEPDHGEYEAPEVKAETPKEDRGRAVKDKPIKPDWYATLPRELAEHALTRYIVCQYMLLLA